MNFISFLNSGCEVKDFQKRKPGARVITIEKSESWTQIQRFAQMVVFLPFGINPWGYRFQGAFGNSIQSTRKVDQYAGFLLWWKKMSDFLHHGDIKSLNSAKSLNNLIPGKLNHCTSLLRAKGGPRITMARRAFFVPHCQLEICRFQTRVHFKNFCVC